MVSVYHWKDGAGFFIPGMLLLIVINAVIPASAQEQVNEEEGHTSASSLFIALFANGDALVEHNVGIEDPLAQEIGSSFLETTSMTLSLLTMRTMLSNLREVKRQMKLSSAGQTLQI